MNLHPSFARHIETRFAEFFQAPLSLSDVTPVQGGDINQCYRLDTSSGPFFMKVNASLFGLDFFEKEARGLIALANTGTITVPRPLFDGKFHQQVYLVMEVLEKGKAESDFWETFGQSMAALHQQGHTHYGLDYPNYIGKLHQVNTPEASWPLFYEKHRILPLVYKAMEKQLLALPEVEQAEALCTRFAQLFPDEKPSLLHGDLWSGNYMVTRDGKPAIFDPATYFGHREMDLAMARLFGGFDARFFAAYQASWPLAPGWEERIPLCQLYPLLVHLLLFGGKYRSQVTDILKKFS